MQQIERSIEFYAADFLISTAELTNEETGHLITQIALAVVRNDLEYLSQFRFLGKIHSQLSGNRVPIPKALRAAIFERDNYTCQYCGTHNRLEIDHIIPYSVVLEHEAENLQILCRSCNGHKGVRYE